jgi:hypothetical protein
MKIARARIIKMLFSVGASIAPKPYEIEESDWRVEQPLCLTGRDGGVWVAERDYRWVEGNSFEVGPQGTPLFRINGSSRKQQFDIKNISGNGRFCVIKRHDDHQSPILY